MRKYLHLTSIRVARIHARRFVIICHSKRNRNAKTVENNFTASFPLENQFPNKFIIKFTLHDGFNTLKLFHFSFRFPKLISQFSFPLFSFCRVVKKSIRFKITVQAVHECQGSWNEFFVINNLFKVVDIEVAESEKLLRHCRTVTKWRGIQKLAQLTLWGNLMITVIERLHKLLFD